MGFIRVTGNSPTIPTMAGSQGIVQEFSVPSTRLMSQLVLNVYTEITKK